MDYFLHILILIAIFQILALSLDLLAGHSGLLSVAHAAFFGIGAYSTAILTAHYHTPSLIGLLVGITIAACLSAAISLPTLRLHEDYFVIGSFGFQVIIASLFNNWTSLTNGPMGIVTIPHPGAILICSNLRVSYLVLVTILLTFSLFIFNRVIWSPFGRILHAIREDSVLPAAYGKNLLGVRMRVFALAAALASAAGSVFAHYITYIDPTSFTIMDSVLIVTMVILGGAGTFFGPLIGAALLVLLPEVMRFAGLPSELAGNAKQLIYGLILLFCILFRPEGLMGRYAFRKGSRCK
jgi:branched-chain amino acid transport system permease protein